MNEDAGVNHNDQQQPWVVDRALPLIDQAQTLNEDEPLTGMAPLTIMAHRRLTTEEHVETIDNEATIPDDRRLTAVPTTPTPPIVRPTIASLSKSDQIPSPISSSPPPAPPSPVTKSPPQSQPPSEPLTTTAASSSSPFPAPPIPDNADDQSTSSNSSTSSSSITINDTLKVIFVGMANVGKTSIIRRLIKGPDTTIPLPDERTIGVDIYDWTPPPPSPTSSSPSNNDSIYPPNKSVKFSVWDFAGQHVYHATHELFFSPRALYVIVWDMAVQNEATYIQRRQIHHHRQNDLESGPFQLDSSSSSSDDDDDDDDGVRRRRHHGVSPSTALRQDSEMRRTADHALRQDIDDKVQFWIDCIQSRVPGAAILIVASFSDCFSKDGNNNATDDVHNNNGTTNSSNPTKTRRHSHRQQHNNNNDEDEIKRRCQALKKRVLGMEQRRMKGIETRWAKLLKEKNANTDDAARLQRLLSPLNRPKLIFGGSASPDAKDDEYDDGRGNVIHVSAKDYLNFDTLRNAIVGIATGRERITDWDLPVFGGHVGARIPQVWIEVRGAVREMRRRFKVVEWRHFLKTLEETRGIRSERDVSDALHFLTDVGELSYFGSRMEAGDLDREFPMESNQMHPDHTIRPFADDDYDTDDEEYRLAIDGCSINTHDRNSPTSTPHPNLPFPTPSQSCFTTPPTPTPPNTTTTTTPNNNPHLSNLSQFIFLNPRWLVAALACILRHDLNREIATIRRLHDLPPSPHPYRDAGSNNCPLVTSTDACYLWDAQKVTKKAASRAWDYRGEVNGEAVAEEGGGVGGGGGEEVILRPYEFLQLLLVRFGIFVPIDLTAIDNVCFGGRDYGCYEGIANAQEGGLQHALPANAPPSHDHHHHTSSCSSNTSLLSEDESSSRLQPSTCYFLPSLLGSGAEPAEAWSYKSREAWKVTLCHSLLFPDGVPPGMMERIIAFVLRDVNTAVRQGGIIGVGLADDVCVNETGEGDHEEQQGVKETNNNNNTNAASESFRVHEILCWRTAFLLKLGMEVDGRSSIVEIFTSLVDRENPICVGSDSMGVGMCRLILSAKGQEGDGGRKIWRGGYDLVIRAICRVMIEYSGLEFEKHAVCPECLAKKRASEASVWSINYLRKALRNNDTYIRCNHGHRVLLSLVSGYRKKQVLPKDYHHVSNDDGLLLHDSDAKQQPLFYCGGHSSGGGKSVCDLLGGVVLVGLWDAELGAIVTAGSGFVIDKKRGLIVTAAHTLINVDGRGDAPYGEDYLGRKRGEVVIGVIPTANDDNGNNDGVGMRPTAVFRYFAEIAAKDPLIADNHKCEVDACILRITSRMENDVAGDGRGCKDQPQIPLKHDKEAMKREHLQELKCTETCSIEENVRILGFNQGGEGLTTPGTHLNRCADFAKGHVCMIFHTEETEDVVFHPTQELRPREEIVVICTTIGGHSGGPCVNHQGEVIGILSRADPAEKQRCYLVPTRRWKGLVKKAKKRSHPMNEFGF